MVRIVRMAGSLRVVPIVARIAGIEAEVSEVGGAALVGLGA
jgi:hypothetical protein